MRERTSWLTIHPDLAEALKKWCESASGGEPDRLVHVEHGLTSVRFPVSLIEPFLEIIREDFRVTDELSNVAAFSSGPSPHEDCLAKNIFVDDECGGVLESERVKQTRQEEVTWCRSMGVWEPVLRKDMEANGPRQFLNVG